MSDTLRPHERLIADSCLANSSEGAKAIGQHGEGSYFVLATAPGWAMHKAVREEGLLLRTRRRRGRRFCMGRAGKSSPNLPARDFEAEDPMAKPAADVAEFRVGGAKPRLSPVVDPCSDEVVAYSISGPPNMKTAPGMPAGLEGRIDGGDAPLPHSDMGRQHRMPARRLALERTGIARPVSRKGSRLDNAKAENFFSTAKTELCHDWEGRPRCLRGGSGEAYRPV